MRVNERSENAPLGCLS